ncbi:Carboxypeptidase [Plasmodiophora brassicae]
MAQWGPAGWALLVCLIVCTDGAAFLTWFDRGQPTPGPTRSGYLPVDEHNQTTDALFFVFYEARVISSDPTPIILFLQGGPGCASTFGDLYEMGPYRAVKPPAGGATTLTENPFSWANNAAMLFIDAPLGTGFSFCDDDAIPRDGRTATLHLYNALQHFFRVNRYLQTRPLFIVGESYGAKFAARLADLAERKREGPDAPLFAVAGVGLGDGLVAPDIQIGEQADTASAFGLLSPSDFQSVFAKQEAVLRHIERGEWLQASQLRQDMLQQIVKAGAAATLLDVRRDVKYDADQVVQTYLNTTAARERNGARPGPEFLECNPKVDSALAEDRMQSALDSVEFLLRQGIPVLAYQGQFDAQDGVLVSTRWLDALSWDGADAFRSATKSYMTVAGRPALITRQVAHLRHVVVRGAGHMVPHDQPEAARAMIDDWIASIRSASA